MTVGVGDSSKAEASRYGLQQRGWCVFCRMMVRIFYRRREAVGIEKIPAEGPVLLCANHPNALVDPIIIQALCPRIIHPLARSGLFDHALARPFLKILQAVPIYRRQDAGTDTNRNIQSFARCFELLACGEVLLIFPEGQSHSDSRLRTIRTGAARLALGSIAASGVAPTVLPVGLTFGNKGRFRSSVFLAVGEPVELASIPSETPDDAVRRITRLIEIGLGDVTLNADSIEDIYLSRRLERFFALRRGRHRRGTLEQRFRALKKLIESQRILRAREPGEVDALSRRLRQFERLCDHFRVRDYQLTVNYSPTIVTRFVLRTFLGLLVGVPIAIWGAINSAVPLVLTRWFASRLAQGSQEYDTARMAFALATFLVSWGIQAAAVFWFFGGIAVSLYLVSLPPATAAAVIMYREKDRIVENIKGFFLFLRKTSLRDHLLARREELEKELARMARLMKRQSD
ncbi:MAG: 1-acyl-sn-glycerol-3-phosphate acyltransferase [Acidiferrobacterales bacterium]